jgi:two-component system, OmpR family, alkaline phosphatase synthesis response regulator PhoP
MTRTKGDNFTVKASILVIEDDETLRVALRDRLRGEGYVVDVAKDAEEGMDRINAHSFDLLIIDVMLPYQGGFDLCRNIRSSGIATPIMFLTARSGLVDRVVGLKLGGDDYVTKPFEAEELAARVEVLLKRAPANHAHGIHEIGSLRVDVQRKEVTRRGDPVELTNREFQLLCYLMTHVGRPVPKDELLRQVWGYETKAYSRTVDVHIFSLRKKLEVDSTHPELIKTVTGVGYKLVRR